LYICKNINVAPVAIIVELVVAGIGQMDSETGPHTAT
jgi:hypothetical protein